MFWGALSDNHLLAVLVGIGVIWLLTAANVLGARETGQVQLAT